MRRLLILPVCAFLAACGTAPVDIQVSCPPAMTFSPQEWGTLATEWGTLKAEHPTYLTVTKFIPGAMKENQANEACAASQTGK